MNCYNQQADVPTYNNIINLKKQLKSKQPHLYALLFILYKKKQQTIYLMLL